MRRHWQPRGITKARVPRERRTFRVRGVPHDWNRDRLASFLAEYGYAGPSVQSLAIEVHGSSQTATVTFQDVPSQPQEYLPLSDQTRRLQKLILDTAFLGDHKADLIAISGLGGHPFGSFKERRGEHMWLRDALPYDITEEGGNDRPVSRVMVYGYSSTLSQSDNFQNLEDLGTAFHRHLSKLAVAGIYKPMIFIAHSLVVYGIAYFSVPHDGMDIRSLVPMVEIGPNRFLLESIGSFSSQILSIQHREFLETLAAQEDSKIICFYEPGEKGNWKIDGPAAVLVSKSSATHCREWENGPQFICAMDQDDEYEKVVGLIQSLAREARRAQEGRRMCLSQALAQRENKKPH
ncbi:hypothetical protein V8C34DRAFT_316314 [Trichoderma compactum]